MFSGKPAEVVTAAFNRKFQLVLSQVILDEIERNLLTKFNFSRKNAQRLINRLLQISDLYEPHGSVRVIPKNHTDNLILETAVLGRAKYLVTGDKERLLPIRVFRNVKIVDANQFLSVLKK